MEKTAKLKSVYSTLCFYPHMIGVVCKASINAVLGKYNDKAWIKSSENIRKALTISGVNIYIEGIDFVKLVKEPVVFIGNHMSTLETFVLPGIIEPIKHVTFIVKKTLITYPVFGPIMRSRDPIVVTRKNPRGDFLTVMREGVVKLKKGTSLIVFPQSKRSISFDPEEFNTIGIKLARRARVPVIPIALKTDAWGTASIDFIKDYGVIYPNKTAHISFGEPLMITGDGKSEHKKIIKFIQQKLSEWQE